MRQLINHENNHFCNFRLTIEMIESRIQITTENCVALWPELIEKRAVIMINISIFLHIGTILSVVILLWSS